MQESKLREMLNARQATTTGEVSFESTTDDMKRIVEYANKKNTQGSKPRGSMNSIAGMRVIQEPQHRFELSVDGVSDIFDGSLEEAYKRLSSLVK